MGQNRIEILIDVDPNGRGASAIRGISSSLDNFGNSGAGNFDKAKHSSDAFHESLKNIGAFIASRKLLEIGQQIIDVAKDSEKANSQLSASATQAGLAYGDLAAQAKKFSEDARIGTTEATKITAEITRLAQAAGKLNEIDLISTKALDLKKARGLDESELLNLLSAIRSGSSDEPLNRAGFDDPGLSAEKYAKSLGKSTEALSEQEKVLSRLLPFYEQAEIFAGANKDALDSLTGQTELANKTISDLSTSFSNNVANSLEFRDALKFVNESLKLIASYDPITIRIRLQNGENPEDIAKDVANSPVQQVKDYFKNVTGTVLGAFAYPFDLATEGFETANKRYVEAIKGSQKRTVQELTKEITKEQNLLNKQVTDANKQTAINAAKEAEKARIASITSETKALVDALSSKDLTGSQLKKVESFLAQSKKSLSGKDFESFSNKLEAAQKKFNQSIEQGNKKIEDIRKNVTGLFSDLIVKSNSENPFVKIFSETESLIKKVREETRGLSQDIQDAALKQVNLINNKELFGARIDSTLSALDLRNQAKDFRAVSRSKFNPSDDELLRIARNDPNRYREFTNENGFVDDKAKQDFKLRFMLRALIGDNSGASAGNLSTVVGGIDLSKIRRNFIDSVDLSKIQRNIIEPSGTTTGVNPKSPNFPNLIPINLGDKSTGALATIAARSLQPKELVDPNKATIDHLREQLSTIDKLRAGNKDLSADDLAAITDKRIISLTSSLRPEDLTGDLRERAAQSREREAIRLEKQEQEAAKQRTENNELLKQVNKNLEDLKKIAAEKGLAGVLEIVDKTGADIDLSTKSPTQADTEREYSFGGFGIVGGSNR
jgi:hypothetical protein